MQLLTLLAVLLSMVDLLQMVEAHWMVLITSASLDLSHPLLSTATLVLIPSWLEVTQPLHLCLVVLTTI